MRKSVLSILIMIWIGLMISGCQNLDVTKEENGEPDLTGKSYVVMHEFTPEEEQIARLVNPEEQYAVFDYQILEPYSVVEVEMDVYRNGEKTETLPIMSRPLSDESLRNGELALTWTDDGIQANTLNLEGNGSGGFVPFSIVYQEGATGGGSIDGGILDEDGTVLLFTYSICYDTEDNHISFGSDFEEDRRASDIMVAIYAKAHE